MTLFEKPASFANDTKKIASFMARTLKPRGYKKRRNGFNHRLKNGLIHQISIFSVGAYSIDHGKFYIHAGCYIPEAELYRKNVIDPQWVQDGLCAIRGHFPQKYLNIRAVAANLDLIIPHLGTALDALACFENYDPITNDTTKDGRLYLTEPTVTLDHAPLYFETPKPLVKACVLLARGDSKAASKTLQHYLAALRAEESPRRGHIEYVSEWATEMGLHIPSIP